MLELRYYQKASVNAVYDFLREKPDLNPCVVLPTGAGKSLVIAKIVSDATSLWDGRVLILAHVKELLEQNAAKIQALCPNMQIGLYSAGLNRRDTAGKVIVAGIQSVYNKACDLGSFDLVIVDECFPAGTMIDTPRGQIPIEELYVGQPVRHALGVSNIEAISSRPTRELVQLELNNGRTIRCTPNHPFFTECGWRPAGSLAVGTRLYSREDVSRLREGVSTEHLAQCGRSSQKMSVRAGMEEEEVLFQPMPMPGTAQAESGQAAQGLVEAGGAGNKQEVSMLRKGDASGILQREARVPQNMGKNAFLLNLLRKESGQSNVPSWHCGESFQELEGNRAFPETARREWERTHQVAEGIGGSTGCTDRIFCSDNTDSKGNGCAALLQAGCGDSVDEACFSIGREFAFGEEDKGIGQEHEVLAGGIRVVGVAHIELESPCAVYNLQVEGHPSYYADGVLVHNCHLIAPDGEGMYRTFLNDARAINDNVRLIGLTATPYRLRGGLICKRENLLNEICYEVGVRELIYHGFLSKLVSKNGTARANLEGIHVKAGEFVAEEVAERMDNASLVQNAVWEILKLTKDRKKVLIFASSVAHAQHVKEAIEAASGEECGIVVGNTSRAERDQTLDRFKDIPVQADLFGNLMPNLKYLVNVGVLTTGFDAPAIDTIVLLRPTASAGLYYQMVGRGFRLSPDKEDCMILDYGQNIMRHGPVDMIQVEEKKGGKSGPPPMRECPQCHSVFPAGRITCPDCGYEMPRQERDLHHGIRAASDGILSDQASETEYEVRAISYHKHFKRNAEADTPPTLRVEYQVGFSDFISEWVCIEHDGYARSKAVRWWKARTVDGGKPLPATVDEAVWLAENGYLMEPSKIKVRRVPGDKWPRICGATLEPPRNSDDYDLAAEWIASNIDDLNATPFDDTPPGSRHDMAEAIDDVPF